MATAPRSPWAAAVGRGAGRKGAWPVRLMATASVSHGLPLRGGGGRALSGERGWGAALAGEAAPELAWDGGAAAEHRPPAGTGAGTAAATAEAVGAGGGSPQQRTSRTRRRKERGALGRQAALGAGGAPVQWGAGSAGAAGTR